MKKVVVSLMLCALSLGVHAQEKGDKFFSTSVGVGITKAKVYQEKELLQENDPLVEMSLSVGVHGFVARHFRFGFDLQGCYLNNINGDTEMRSKQVDFGPVFAYYVPLGEKFYYVPQFGASYLHVVTEVEHPILDEYYAFSKNNGFGFYIAPLQFEVRPSQHLGLTMGLFNISFVRMIEKLDDGKSTYHDGAKYKTSGFSFDLGANPNVGLHVYF